jgi:hypothetical protein
LEFPNVAILADFARGSLRQSAPTADFRAKSAKIAKKRISATRVHSRFLSVRSAIAINGVVRLNCGQIGNGQKQRPNALCSIAINLTAIIG